MWIDINLAKRDNILYDHNDNLTEELENYSEHRNYMDLNYLMVKWMRS